VQDERILYAITSHGLGHVTRSLAVARALRDLHPQVEWVIATTVARERLERDLPPPFVWRPVAYEPGVVQSGAFHVDRDGTCDAYLRWRADYPARLREETEFLQSSGCRAVVADVPALAVRAASEVGIPAVAVANFTWDWILAPILDGGPTAGIVEALAADYARATLHLRLPFGPEASPIARCEAAPLVSRRARLAPVEVRRRLALPEREPARLVVVCPGGWDARDWRPIHVRGCRGVRFVTVGDLPVRAEAPLLALPHDLPSGVAFTDLVAAADVVIAKPGYGIASECWLHRTALISIERPAFRESPLLIDEFARCGPSAAIGLDPFFAGEWEAALAGVSSRGPWSPAPEDGAERVAARIAEVCALRA